MGLLLSSVLPKRSTVLSTMLLPGGRSMGRAAFTASLSGGYFGAPPGHHPSGRNTTSTLLSPTVAGTRSVKSW